MLRESRNLKEVLSVVSCGYCVARVGHAPLRMLRNLMIRLTRIDQLGLRVSLIVMGGCNRDIRGERRIYVPRRQ
jgi:hypothetical protein